MKPRVTVVVPTIDGGEMLLDCLMSIGANHPSIELVIVDNGSRDGSVDRALATFGDAKVVRNETNRGYAPACNQGAALATADLILFLNNDAKVSPAALDRLLDATGRDDRTAIWQAVTLTEDGDLESTGDRFTWWGINRHLEQLPTEADGRTDVEVFATVAAALLVRRSAFEDLGGFEDSYFAYYEESDLCWRARLAGYDVRVVTDATIEHLGSATTGRVFEPHAVRYLSFRNRIRTNLCNPSAAYVWQIMPLHVLACIAFIGFYAVTGRLRSASAVLQALWWPVGNRDVWTEQRARTQALRRRPDAEVFRRDLVTSFGPRTLWRHLRRSYWFEAASRRVSDSSRKN